MKGESWKLLLEWTVLMNNRVQTHCSGEISGAANQSERRKAAVQTDAAPGRVISRGNVQATYIKRRKIIESILFSVL